ncbi:hypothetical protein Tco_0600901 [Tanacetum coccineum]
MAGQPPRFAPILCSTAFNMLDKLGYGGYEQVRLKLCKAIDKTLVAPLDVIDSLMIFAVNEYCADGSIWEALEGNTRDLDSIWEETEQDYNFTRSGFKNARTVPGDGVAIPSDVIRTYKRWRQKLCDGVRM